MKKLKFTQAFTGVEVLLVMALLMMIAGLIIVSSRGVRENAKKRKAEAMIAALEVAISMYQADTGEYPPDAILVNNLTSNPGGVIGPRWHGPYIEFKREDYQNDNPATNTIVDPWHTAYNYDGAYEDEGALTWGNINSCNLWSNGPNKNNDSSDGDTNYGDDIYNW